MLCSAAPRLHRTFLACAALTLCFVACTDAAVLPARIDADLTLTAADSPWEMRSDVFIAADATVTVEPNVHVVAHGDYQLTVSGALIAMAPAGHRIVFRAPDIDATGAWKGLYFTRGSVGRFQRCTFRSARDNLVVDSANVQVFNCHVRRASRDGLLAWGDAFVRIAHCRFQNNGRHGVQIQTNAPTGVILSSEFIGNGAHPVLLKAGCVKMLRSDNVFERNGVQAIGVDCDGQRDIQGGHFWREQELPLDMTVGSANAELVIDEGAVLRIESGMRIYPPKRIVVRGRLLIDGLPEDAAVIQPQGAAAPGAWLGIALEPGAQARLSNATVGFARSGFSVHDASLFLRNTLIRDCEQDGVFAGGTAHVDIAGSTFSACGRHGVAIPQATSTAKIHTTRVVEAGDYPMRLAAAVAGALRHGNSWRDNGRQAIGVICSAERDIEGDVAWLPQGIPFDLTADPQASLLTIAAGGRLSLRAGVAVVGGGINASGVFVAAGTAEAPVTFGSHLSSPAPGDWLGIEFAPGSAGRLVNARVRHAQTGVNVQSDGWIQLLDSTFSHCSVDGIRIAGSSQPLISGCRVTENGRWGVSIWHEASPFMGQDGAPGNPGRNVLLGNGEYDLANHKPTAVLAQRNWWGTTDTAVIGSRILDRSFDPARGPVNFTPFLQLAPAATVASAEVDVQLAVLGVSAQPTANGAAIHVSLSRPANVRLTIRNIAGRTIREIVTRSESSDVILWDGRDLRGSNVPSGPYLVDLEALCEQGERARSLTTLSMTR